MIEIEQIRKRYKETQALDGFTLSVADGELFGLIGPNGAGKTTLMKILSTLIHPTSGRALVSGIDVTRDPKSVKRIVGYLPDQPGLYLFHISLHHFTESNGTIFLSQPRVIYISIVRQPCSL